MRALVLRGQHSKCTCTGSMHQLGMTHTFTTDSFLYPSSPFAFSLVFLTASMKPSALEGSTAYLRCEGQVSLAVGCVCRDVTAPER